MTLNKIPAYLTSILLICSAANSYAAVQWIGDNASELESAGFTCVGNVCTSGSNTDDVEIINVGTNGDPASLVFNHTAQWNQNAGAFQMSGDVYMDFTNNGNITGPLYGVYVSNGAQYNGNITNSLDAKLFGDDTAVLIEGSTFNGDIINYGKMDARLMDAIAVKNSVFNGNILNSGEQMGSYRSIYIDSNSVFNGYIQNDGVMNTYAASIYNESASLIDYRGSGQMDSLHTMGGVEFSNMDRTPIRYITGSGGITYSNRAGDTTIHLKIPAQQSWLDDSKIVSNIGDLTLKDITLSLDITTSNPTYSGLYNVAKSNTAVNGSNLTWLLNGSAINSDDYTYEITGWGTKEVWFDLYLNYWTQGDNTHLTHKGFTCEGENECETTVQSDMVLIKSVGLSDEYATLTNNHNIIGSGSQHGIEMRGGENYLDIQNYATISGQKGIFLSEGNKTTGSIINATSGTISGVHSGIFIDNGSEFTGEIFNQGTISGDAYYGIYMYMNSQTNGNIINQGNITGARSGIYAGSLSDHTGYIHNSGNISGSESAIYYGVGGKVLDYRGSGTLTGGIYVANGIEISDFNRTAINDIRGTGGITYSNKGGATTLHLAYDALNRDTAQVLSTIGNLTLRDITIDMNIAPATPMWSGSYHIASSNTIVNASNIEWLFGGNELPEDWAYFVRGIGTADLWLDIALDFWTNGDNSHLTTKSFTCVGNDCESTIASSGIWIKTIGTDSDQATLTMNHDHPGSNTGTGMLVQGTNYLDVINNTTLAGADQAFILDTNATMTGYIANNANITGATDGIVVRGNLDGYIRNDGDITAGGYVIKNENANQRIDYRGNGTLNSNDGTAKLHSEGGFEFSDIDGAAMNEIADITGSGGIIYSNKGGNTTLRLNYNDTPGSVPLITSTIGDLVLSGITIDILTHDGGCNAGKYYIASSNTHVIFDDVNLLINGDVIDPNYEAFHRGVAGLGRAIGDIEYWVDIVNMYWTNGDNSHLEYKDFTCVGTVCVSTADTIAPVRIREIGSSTQTAQLTVDNNIAQTAGENGILIGGENYLDMMVNASISGDSGIAITSGASYTGNIINAGTINGTENGIAITDAAMNGYIQNDGTISGGTFSIYSYQGTAPVDYRGNGTLSGDVYTDTGIIFSAMDRAPINNVQGSGGITYSNVGGATTLNLAYGSGDMSTSKIISAIGDLSLLNVNLNMTLDGGKLVTGQYLLASITDLNSVLSYNGLTLMDNGNVFGSGYAYNLRLGNNGTELWLDLTAVPDVDIRDERLVLDRSNTSALFGVRASNRLSNLIQRTQYDNMFIDHQKHENHFYTDRPIYSWDDVKTDGLWVEYFNGRDKYREHSGVAEFNDDVMGVVVGWDKRIAHSAFGLAVSYTHGDGKSDFYHANSNAYSASIYGSYDTMRWFVVGNVGYSFVDVDNKSDIVDDWSDKGNVYFGTASAGRMFMTPNFTGHLYGKFDYLYGDFSKDENYQAMVASIGTDLKYSFQLNNAGLRLMPSIYYEIGYDFSDDASIYAMGSNTVLGEYNLGDIVQRYGAKVGLINGMGTKVNVGAEMIHQDNYRNVEFRVEALFKF